ncbi:MAG: carboxypeptidase-like regulatory domain-containing protein [Cytophagales bacterium]
MKFINNTLSNILKITLILISTIEIIAQNSSPTPIQFSGVVFTEDSTTPVPFTTLYVPKTGRGVIANQFGIFTMPVLPYDSVVIVATGYKRSSYKIPGNTKENSISMMISLSKDTLELPAVEVFPYQTEEIFKQAFLALRLPEQHDAAMQKTLNDRIIAMMSSEAPADGQMNHKWYAQQYALAQERKYSYAMAYNNFLNPIAWAQFINSLRKGKYKKKEYDEKGNLKK